MFSKRITSLYSFLMLVICLTMSVSFAQVMDRGTTIRLTEVEMDELGIYEGRLLDLDLSTVRAGQPFKMNVVLDEQEYTLDLYPRTVRSSDLKVQLMVEGGELVDYIPPPPMTYQGTVRGQSGSAAAVGIVDGGLYARVEVRSFDSEIWYIQPFESNRVRGSSHHVVYNNYEVIADSRWKDIYLPNPNKPSGFDREETDGFNFPMGAPTGTDYSTEVAWDVDYDMYVKNGSSEATTLADIDMVLNVVDIVYRRDVDITWELVHVIIRTVPGTYTTTSPNTLLNKLRQQWKNNHTNIHRDLVHLFTGKNLDGSTIGIAWVKSVCDSVTQGYGYGLTQSKFTSNLKNRNALSSHEMGHNYGCNGHCDSNNDCYIMCSGLGGCDGVGLPNFGPWAVTRITNYRDNHINCLDPVPAASVIDVSANIGSNDIVVNVSPPDMNGQGSGKVPFSREYADGTMVTLTAPKEYAVFTLKYRLSEWNIDGVPQTPLENVLSMPADFAQLRADYNIVREFPITSSPSGGIPVSVDPPDLDGTSNGATPLDVVYFNNTDITLTAPLSHGPFKFVRWITNGDPQPVGQNVVDMTVVFLGSVSAKAEYFLAPWMVPGLIRPVPTSPSLGTKVPK
ncbi:MAG: zinc-dependent metalloprotease family protein [Planctomycetota bacterium]|jgi:hypothetical protein